MPPTPVWMTLTDTSSCGRLAISSSKASSEPDTSALSTRSSSLTSPSWMPLKTSSKDILRPERRACISSAQADGALVGQLAGGAVVLDDAHEVAGVGDAVEAEHLDRVAGDGLLHAVALVVDHRADLAPVLAGDERVADAQRAALDQHGDDRAAARVELGLDDDAGGVGVGVGLELLELGDDEDRVEQVLEALAGLGRDVDELGVAAPLGGLQAELRHLGAHARRVGALLVDLVDRDDDRHVGGAGVVDRLVGLRHDAVVGGDHDHGDVGDLGAAGAHGGERLVARGVEEGDRLVVVVDLVGADVLGDAAGLARGDLGRRMASSSDVLPWSTWPMIVTTGGRSTRSSSSSSYSTSSSASSAAETISILLVELVGEDLDGLVGQRLGERDHLAHAHQLLDDVGDRHAEVLGDVLDRRAGVDPDQVGAGHDVLGERGRDLFEDLATAPATAAAALGGPPTAGRHRDRPGRRGHRARGARPASR